MNLQGAPTFSPEDYPDVPAALLQRLTEAFDELYSVAQSIPESIPLPGKKFTTDSGGSAYLDVKNPLAARPTEVRVGELRPVDGSPIASVYSATWFMASDAIRILFVGLSASADYSCTVVVQ